MSVGLVLTELVLNAAKYAYGGQPGVIEIDVEGSADRLRVIVRDYGGGVTQETPKGGGFGSKLMVVLVQRLRGELRRAGASPGHRVTLEIPLHREAAASSAE